MTGRSDTSNPKMPKIMNHGFETARLIAFVPVTDVDAARAFYRDALGLTLVDENPAALVFDANGTMVRVTPVGELPARPYTVVGWAVDDIRATVKDLTDNGVTFRRYDGMDQDELGVWTTPGDDLVAWFTDPAGNTLSLTQFGQG